MWRGKRRSKGTYVITYMFFNCLSRTKNGHSTDHISLSSFLILSKILPHHILINKLVTMTPPHVRMKKAEIFSFPTVPTYQGLGVVDRVFMVNCTMLTLRS